MIHAGEIESWREIKPRASHPIPIKVKLNADIFGHLFMTYHPHGGSSQAIAVIAPHMKANQPKPVDE